METPPSFTPEVPPVMPQSEINNQPQNVKYPALLTTTCIFSFIGAFFYLIYIGLLAIFPIDLMSDIFESIIAKNSNLFIVKDELRTVFDNFLSFIPYAPYLFLIKLISVVGVILMMNKKEFGLWIYIFAQVIILAIETYFSMVGVLSYIFTILFIVLYALGIKQLKRNQVLAI